MKLSNSYADLGEQFHEKIHPVPVRDPQPFLWNHALADDLLIPDDLQNDPPSLARVFSGNRLLPGSQPIATAYAGHQFGNFVPRLGDGRAHLLGEITDRSGRQWDIQLKGSGRTPFSRGGDGRCALGPAIREFIMSEAMHALGVPTTRCLGVVTTGEPVMRETLLPGAVVTRVASSHIRIGTFQYFAAKGDIRSLETLCTYTMERHYPELLNRGDNRYLTLFERLMERQIRLVVEWMRVGFIHGVMNTDNSTLSGETIDYGPCAMLGIYDPETVYSSIDVTGRYAFGNQSAVAQWNLIRFAECLLPLIHEDAEKAANQVRPLLGTFMERFDQAYMTMMGKKIGLRTLEQNDAKLIHTLLNRLEHNRLDYTITFDLLTESLTDQSAATRMDDELAGWVEAWRKRLGKKQINALEIQERMRSCNPVVIPRNHHVEAVIAECVQSGKPDPAQALLRVLGSPYAEVDQTRQYQDPPLDGDKGYQTFCGT
ncbi:protein adenylyltransferase SelO [Desulfoplanes sp.]